MGKKGKGSKKDNGNPPKRRSRDEYVAAEDMDDEVDAFHKQRDKILLDVNGDAGESDENNELPVFDFEDINDDEEEDDDVDDDAQLTGLAAKIARQQKYLRAKMGGVEDEMHDDDEEEEEKRAVWGRRKNIYYNADNVDYELQSSDEELPAEEEAEVLRLQREKAKSLSMEDFGLDDVSQDDSDGEPTLEEMSVKGKSASKSSAEKDDEDDTGAAYAEIEKDLNSLSREEQMDVVYSSAPELVGLLSELNDALEQLEKKVNPLLSKVKEEKNMVKGGMHYLEVKQALLLAYCQAINFYLLLKSEGQPVRDHPVIARLVEIKSLLDKIKQLDEHLAFDFEEILSKQNGDKTEVTLVSKNATLASDFSTKIQRHSLVSAETQGTTVAKDTTELVKLDSSKDHGIGEKRKRQNDQVGIQSMEMLKVRASLEEKLKRKGIFSSHSLKPDKTEKLRLQPVNGQLETVADFDDETINMEGGRDGLSNGHANSLRNKVSQLITKVKKPKIVSGDDDLPMRDDIGERRRKHELQVLTGAGINSEDEFVKLEGDEDAVMKEDSETGESEDDFYRQVEQKRAAKLAAKAEIYSRPSAAPSLPEALVDGKRQISYQIEKNRGLTRARNKLKKNPRKNYKLKHKKAEVRRKGQVRDIKKPSGPYGGEASGINAGISRSVRFKN